ncbi:MAG: hypothetical protein OEU92_01830 [Alphaproteobacteria bacterium]|nr:hypothetical protein [Alphaproteobacteria bacterium]
MMAPCDEASDPNLTVFGARAGRRPHGKPVRVLFRSRAATGGPLSTLGMALGYIGLVAILTIAPFMQQATVPHQGRPMVCTDFGGSR